MPGNWNSGCLRVPAGMARSFRGTSWMLKRCKQARQSCWRSLAHGEVLTFEEWPPPCECVFRSRQLGEIASICQGTVSTSLFSHSTLPVYLFLTLFLSPWLSVILHQFFFFYTIFFISCIQFSTSFFLSGTHFVIGLPKDLWNGMGIEFRVALKKIQYLVTQNGFCQKCRWKSV